MLVLLVMSVHASQVGHWGPGMGCNCSTLSFTKASFRLPGSPSLCADVQRWNTNGQLLFLENGAEHHLPEAQKAFHIMQDPHNHEGGVEERVACRKGLSPCHHFLNSSFSKENECKQNPQWAINRRTENTEKKLLYYSSHHYT